MMWLVIKATILPAGNLVDRQVTLLMYGCIEVSVRW
jgi:hypothetical protein